MQFKLAFVTVALATLAVATPSFPRGGGDSCTEPASSCSTGPIQCCNSIQQTTSDVLSTVLGILGISLSGVTGLVGLTCSPVTVVGGVSTCSANAVCCTDNSYGGLISVGCIPVTL
ncbi:fungal hydrophobin [Gymnopus androsaceus JB14]|uniref:Hydrophobin n=1 Tax=Gymnopus androsaceus JB14 TaxID=1447944 RepID=A0A6A4H8D8_9AGAR|nr:fungal hydrophobin [Gymnopus androsaceus JB14]